MEEEAPIVKFLVKFEVLTVVSVKITSGMRQCAVSWMCTKIYEATLASTTRIFYGIQLTSPLFLTLMMEAVRSPESQYPSATLHSITSPITVTVR
jgi:hypothetical protein